ncbi:gp58-like family protein, partial [Lactobacillus delbrueckii subsp. bulgaricus]
PQGPQGADGTDAPTITVKSYTFSAANGARADIELTGPNAFKQTVYSRGHNVWVLDATTHKLKEFVNCDTFITMSFNHNGVNTTLADYLASLTDSVVVIAAADADTVDQNVRNVLNSMGGSPELGTWDWRVGHVFIGMSKRSDGTWPLQPRQGYEEVVRSDGSAPEIGCALSNGGIVANGAIGPKGDTGDTGFFIGTTPPPNPTKGTVWATNDASGNMVSAKTWDGSNWVSTAFTQDLVAGNISATKIVGGELDVNKITIKNAQNIPITSTVSLGDKLSNIEQNAEGLKLTAIGGGNLLNNTSDTLQKFTGTDWMWYVTSNDEPVAKHLLDGKTVTLSAWIENPSKEAWVQMWTDKGVGIGNRIPAGGSGWSQVTYTMPSGFTYWNIVVGCGDGSGTITLSYSSLQLELGPNRTAWSQSTADVSTIQETANSLNAYVSGSNGSKTLAALLSMDPNNSTIGQIVNGHVVAAINTSSDGSVKIDGKTLHITTDTKIENAVIKSAMIDRIDASKITTGTLDASHINVINLDANSITTGSLSAALYSVTDFTNYFVSATSSWDFNLTKSAHGNWFLNGETTADHVYNGPKDIYGNKLTPYMYVTSRGSADGTRFTVTVWKDNDPTQYQRVWNGSSWSDWVMLPNSQNLVSAINLSPDSVKISGKNIELDGNTRIADGFTLSADKIRAGTLNGVTITGSKFIANTDNGNLFGTLWKNYQVTVENTGVNIHGTDSSNNDWEAILTSDSLYLQMVNDNNTWTKSIDISIVGQNPHINLVNSGPNAGQYSSTYIGSDGVQASIGQFGNWRMQGSKVFAQSGSLYVTNPGGDNFDSNGSVGFQVWGGIGLGQNTIYMPGNDLYVQQGNCGPGLGARYSDSGKVKIHCQKVVSQVANTVSSRLSVKTDIAKVTYDRALAAVEGTEMYDYRYISDDSGQHYVSGIIDDVNPEPQYHMDEMLINKERTARIDANLLGYHHVIIQKLLDRVAALEEKVKQ